MQSMSPLTADDFRIKAKIFVSKLEIYMDPAWINLCNLSGKNYLIEAHYSSGQKELSYKPVAASFDAVIDDTDGDFHPENDEGQYKTYLKVGRKIRFWTGFKKNSTDYLWQWFEGIISDIDINRADRRVIIKGFDYTQYLSEVKLKSPDNYWGTFITKSTVDGQAEYDMPGTCNGVYIAYLDGLQIYDEYQWVYDRGNKKFIFLPDYVPTENGSDDLVIYYYTDQVPENVVADLLVSAGLYVDRAAALAAMDYTATGEIIDRVRFSAGVSTLYAIQKMCERVDYEFFFKYNNTPLFKPIST